MNTIKTTISSMLGFVPLLTAMHAHAAGFALIEQSGSGMGNAFAGAAAAAEDASTIHFNPAGITRLSGRQIAIATHAIRPTAHFDNQDSTPGTLKPLGNDGGDAGDLAWVPNFYYAMELSPEIRLGLGVNAPFGLKTEYNDQWLGRYQAIKSELKTLNINPSLAVKVNDQLSLGFGISAMRIEAELTSAVNPVFVADETGRITGKDWGYGYNLGALYQLNASTRIGVAYRSKIDQHLEGKARFSGVAAVNNTDVTAQVSLPETLSLSTFSQLNDKWDVMADITWSHWSRFRELRVIGEAGNTLTSTQENWENTLRYSVGANYHYSDALKLRAGLAYDEEAIRDEYRTARIPGNDRTWMTVGASWKISPSSTLDVGYAHLFLKDAPIDDDQRTLNNGRIKGEYEGHINILSAQLTYTF